MKVKKERIYAPSENVVARLIEDEIILVPITSGIGDMEDELYTLNETGRKIWHSLDGKASLKTIINKLVKEYKADPGFIEEDVLGLVEELLQRGILIEVIPK